MDFTRQQGIVDSKLLSNGSITLVGAGAIGSFTALAITKMGIAKLEVFDEDGVSEHNLPNQFFRSIDIRAFKVSALYNIIYMFCGAKIKERNKFYTKQKLQNTVIVATDSMSSRRRVWEQFKAQSQCKVYIEARMGAELGMVYTIKKDKCLDNKDREFYESMLYSDNIVKPLPCTARSIIYNILMIASLICRAYKGIVCGEAIPKEQIFNMQEMNKASYMVRE